MNETQEKQPDATLDAGTSRTHPAPIDLAPLMRRLGVPKGTFYPWLRGDARPPARIVSRIAQSLNLPLPHVVKTFWRENVGDPCPCECGGEKDFPKSPRARALVIKLPCGQCGSIRFYYGRTRHSKICRKCKLSAERVKRIPYTCPGYSHYGPTCSKKCRGPVQLAPWKINQLRKRKEHNPNIHFDESKKEYRCSPCRKARHILPYLKKKLREFYSGPIKGRRHFSKLLHKYEADMFPEFKPDVKKIRNQKRATGPSLTKGRTVWWWCRSAKDLPRFVRFGFCIRCDKISIRLSGKKNQAPKFHKRCYHEWMRTPEGKHAKSLWRRGQEASTPQSELKLRVRAPVGLSGTEASLKFSFSCAVQYYLAGKSDQTIADENGVGRASVNERIKFMIENLPDPDLLIPRFQRIVRLLLDAAKERTRRSVVALNR